jgi:tRNA-splicing ligase RtcB
MADIKLPHNLSRIEDNLYVLDREYKSGMRVPGYIYASEILMRQILEDNSLSQVANVATLPGIVRGSFAMPDIHWGYGFVIGGVAAFDPGNGGIVSPGGVGYDINCGVRLIRSDLDINDIADRIEPLIHEIFLSVPVGVGSEGNVSLSGKKMERVLRDGAEAIVAEGMSWPEDLEYIEESGAIDNADPSVISDKARKRGEKQCGTLGAGNHFVEIQKVDEIFDPEAARAYGLEKGMITVMIHTGSRGLGHQVCDDHLRILRDAVLKYEIDLPDRQLACAPLESKEGKEYLSAMACAANFAWANRSIITHLIRRSFEQIFGEGAQRLGLNIVYDVAHNIAKWEKHDVGGKKKRLLVHRKGATRAFPSGHCEIPYAYREIGQPVLIPGDMGTSSWVLQARPKAMDAVFGSTCHGAGRAMGRGEAKRSIDYDSLMKDMDRRGILVCAGSRKGLVEEAPDAYKDVDEVVNVTDRSGISTKVARLKPIAVIKG